MEFSEDVKGLVESGISVRNAKVQSVVAQSRSKYLVTIENKASGLVDVFVLGEATTDDALNKNLASNVVSYVYDNTYSCGLKGDGKIICWGTGTYGQLGNSANNTAQLFAQEIFPSVWRDGSTLHRHISGQQPNLRSCGLGGGLLLGLNTNGELDIGTQVGVNIPKKVVGSHIFSSISAGSGFTCGVDGGGIGYCWGANVNGNLGKGDQTGSTIPMVVNTSSLAANGIFLSIQAGNSTACGLTSNHSVYCWGTERFGGLGDGGLFTNHAYAPVATPILSSVSSLASFKQAFSCLILGDSNDLGKIGCWGKQTTYSLGNYGGHAASPTSIYSTPLTYNLVTSGLDFSCALDARGQVDCWGNGSSGQTSQSFFSPVISPLPISFN